MANNFNTVKVKVLIGGKPCDFSYVRLHQTVYGHHTFVIELNYIKYKDLYSKETTWSIHPEEYLQELLGAEVLINMSETSGASNEFVGIVQRVNVNGKDSAQATVNIHGGSPTLLMLDDHTMDAYTDIDTASLVLQTLMNLNIKVDHDLNPETKGNIPFVYRYKESSYDFLRRILTSCGESFYYDGKSIVVGPPSKKDKKDVELNYKYDMLEMNISSGLSHHLVEQYDYDYISDKLKDPTFPDSTGKVDRLTYQGLVKSEEIYNNKEAILPGRMPARSFESYQMMREGLESEHYAKVADQTYITARTNTCKPKLAKVIKIVTDPDIENDYYTELGRYRVVDILHTYDETKGEYKNEFRAVNAEIDHFPIRDVKYPTAMPEVATVLDNADPENMGRVQVQYVWQQVPDRAYGKKTGWMRVQTPDAGRSDSVAKNRGFFFIPEVGDQVMVGYELGDPNRPFVMGSLFHCNNTQGTDAGNNTKSIVTRSGIKIELNDSKKSVNIETPDGSYWFIDGRGNIEVSAPKSLKFKASDIQMESTNSFRQMSGGMHSLDVGGVMSVNSPIYKQHIEQTGHISAGDRFLLNSTKGTVQIEGKQLLAAGADNLQLYSHDEVSMLSTGKIKVSGKAGTDLSNTCDTVELVQDEIKAKCVVQFRPGTNWKGEYGFDWLRTGDTGRPEDNWYRDIMGPTVNGVFTKDLNEYNKILRVYEQFCIVWKKAKNDPNYIYCVPYMSLLKGKTAELTLKIEVDEGEQVQVEFMYNKDCFEVINNTPCLDKGTHALANALKVKCTAEFDDDQYIDAMVQRSGEEPLFAGRFIVKANSADIRRKITVVMVICETNFFSESENLKVNHINYLSSRLKDILNQCYVEVEVLVHELDLRGKKKEYKNYIDEERTLLSIRSELAGDFLDLLNKHYKLKPHKYADFDQSYRLYFLDMDIELSHSRSVGGFARAIDSKDAVIVKDSSEETPAHELLHCLGLRHPFDQDNVYVFEESKTDNVMDYSHTKGLATISTWMYQWWWVQGGHPTINSLNNRSHEK